MLQSPFHASVCNFAKHCCEEVAAHCTAAACISSMGSYRRVGWGPLRGCSCKIASPTAACVHIVVGPVASTHLHKVCYLCRNVINLPNFAVDSGHSVFLTMTSPCRTAQHIKVQHSTAQHGTAPHSTAYPAEVMPADSAGDVVAAAISLYGCPTAGTGLRVLLNPLHSVYFVFFSSLDKQSLPLLRLQDHFCCSNIVLAKPT